jgi:uncharacterized membrane-anchored protein YhcB (DUF1043 family)
VESIALSSIINLISIYLTFSQISSPSLSQLFIFADQSINCTNTFSLLSIVDTAIGLFINVIASGMACVAGLSYVNIRSEKHERPMRIAFCHMFKMLGFAGTYSIMLFLGGNLTQPTNAMREDFYKILGYSIIGATVFFLFMLMINEVRQRQGMVYNYRDCLDSDNSIANNYCKLFSKNEVLIERNTATTGSNLWKSAENSASKNTKSYSSLWSFYLLMAKLHAAIVFHYFLITMTMNVSFRSFDEREVMYGVVLWIMVISAFTGAFMCRIIRIGSVYIFSSIIAAVAIGVSIVFYGRSPPVGVAVCLLIFYAATGLALSVPDTAILEISKIRYNEAMLAIGYFAEIIPIAVLQKLQIDAHILTDVWWYTDEYFIIIVITTIVVLLVTSLIFFLHMPDTQGMSLLQIQNALLKHESYFAFKFDKSGGQSSQLTRNSAESSNYLVVNEASNQNVIIYRERNGNLNNQQNDQLPPPPVNNVKNYDYSEEISKTFTIIPRANLVKTPAK